MYPETWQSACFSTEKNSIAEFFIVWYHENNLIMHFQFIQAGGLHIDKESITYTPERLRNYLKSLVIPEENRNTCKLFSENRKESQEMLMSTTED